MASRQAFVAALATGLMLGAQALAADPPAPRADQQAPTSQQAAPSPQPAPSDTAAPAQPPLQVPAPTEATGAQPSPNLAVATVKLENGTRASKMIGAAVFNDQNQQVGTVDDLILDQSNKAVLAVISVGGFLGVGGKLVAVGYTQLHVDDKGRVMLPDGSKDSLSKMPGFTYGT